jgi:hypothetical protein
MLTKAEYKLCSDTLRTAADLVDDCAEDSSRNTHRAMLKFLAVMVMLGRTCQVSAQAVADTLEREEAHHG